MCTRKQSVARIQLDRESKKEWERDKKGLETSDKRQLNACSKVPLAMMKDILNVSINMGEDIYKLLFALY